MTIEINERAVNPDFYNIVMEIKSESFNVLDILEVLELTGLDKREVSILQRKKDFPQYFCKKDDIIYFLKKDIEQWIKDVISLYLRNQGLRSQGFE